jgi:hypothetical protein
MLGICELNDEKRRRDLGKIGSEGSQSELFSSSRRGVPQSNEESTSQKHALVDSGDNLDDSSNQQDDETDCYAPSPAEQVGGVGSYSESARTRAVSHRILTEKQGGDATDVLDSSVKTQPGARRMIEV